MDGACLETYLALAQPFHFPGAEEFMTVDPWAYRGPACPAEALRALLNRHGASELESCGLIRLGPDGQWAMHPLLAKPLVVFVALRDPDQGIVTNLMTSGGCITLERWPIFAVLRDQHTSSVQQSFRRTLLLTGSIEDTIYLRSCGLAAAPIAGVESLGHEEVGRLSEHYGVRRSPSAREEKERDQDQSDRADAEQDQSDGDVDTTRLSLTIVRWTPHDGSLAEPGEVRGALTYLHDLKKFRGLSLHNVNGWEATAEELAAMKFARAHCQPVWLQDAILDSLDEAKFGSIELEKRTLAPPSANDLVTASEQLQAAMLDDVSSDSSRRRRKDALLAYSQQMNKQVIGPMLQEAQSTFDPAERALQVQCAQLYELFFDLAPRVREVVLRGVRREPSTPFTNDKSLSELLALGSQIAIVMKEIKRCRPSRRPAVPPAPYSNLILTERRSKP